MLMIYILQKIVTQMVEKDVLILCENALPAEHIDQVSSPWNLKNYNLFAYLLIQHCWVQHKRVLLVGGVGMDNQITQFLCWFMLSCPACSICYACTFWACMCIFVFLGNGFDEYYFIRIVGLIQGTHPILPNVDDTPVYNVLPITCHCLDLLIFSLFRNACISYETQTPSLLYQMI